MWFKSAQLYHLKGLPSDASLSLESDLQAFAFTPCLASMKSSSGWVSPFGLEQAALLHVANGYLLFCLQIEEKILPASVIRDALNEEVQRVSLRYERKLSKKEKLSLKDEVTQTLLMRAFTRKNKIYAYIDPRKNLLVIDSASRIKAQVLLELFMRSISGIEVYPFETKRMATVMTEWVKHQSLPNVMSIQNQCVMRDPKQQTRVIRCQQQDLDADAVQLLLQDGCEVVQLRCDWQERIQFALSDPFGLTQIRFSEVLLASAKELGVESEQQQLDADFYMMTQTLDQFFEALLPLLVEKSYQEKAVLV